ncbi:MAG: hypothetical protein LBG46_04225, partial [Elusimicrobiota bacterium]|nr:hypothetical protein [Elusimicrobiota bacterium]
MFPFTDFLYATALIPFSSDPERPYKNLFTDEDLEALPITSQVRAAENLKRFQNVDPSRAARILHFYKETGETVNPAYIDKHLDTYEKAASEPTQENLNNLAKIAPKTTKLMGDKVYAPVYRDKYSDMGNFESMFNQIADGWKKIRAQRELSAVIGKVIEEEKLGGGTGKYERQIQKIKKEMESIGEPAGGFWQRPLRGLNEFAAQQVLSIFANPGVFTGGAAAAGAAGFGIGTIAPGVGNAIGGLGGALTGGFLAVAASDSYKMERNFAYDEYRSLVSKDGQRIDINQARDMAERVGLINAALETVGEAVLVGGVFKPVGKLGAAVLKKGASSTAKAAKASTATIADIIGTGRIANILAKIPGANRLAQIISKNPSSFTGLTVKEAFKRAGANYLTTMTTETGQEYLQEVSSITGGELLKRASAGDFEEQSLKEILGDAAEVITPTMRTMFLPGLTGAGATYYNFRRQIQNATEQKAGYNTIKNTFDNLELTQRSPEYAKAFAQQVSENTGLENVYISKEGFDRIAAENEITPEMLAQELNLTDAYDEAKNSNKIQASMADWIVNSKEAEKKFGKDFSKKFSDDITLDPQEFSVNETKQYIAENAQAAQESVKEAIAAGEIEQKDFSAAKSFVKNQLNQAYKSENFTDSQWTNAIDKQADVMAAMIVQEARKRKAAVSDFVGNMNMPTIKTKLSQRQQNNRELAEDIYGRIKEGLDALQDPPLQEGERAVENAAGAQGRLKDLLDGNLYQFKKKYQKFTGKRLNDRDAQDVHYFLLRQAADEGIEAPQAAYAMHKLKAGDIQSFKTEFENADFNEGTLEQPMLDGIDIQKRIPVLDLSEEEFDNNTPIAEQIKNKLNSLAGQKLTTATENRLIDIIGSDRKKHLRKSSRFRFLKRNPDAKERRDVNLLSIDRLVNNSVLIEIAPNTKTTEKPNVEFYHYFYTPIRIGKDTYTIRLVAEQMKGETGIAPEAVHLYDVIEVSPEANRQNGSLLSGDTISIAEMLANVKDADGNPYISKDMFLQSTADITQTPAFKKWFGDSKVVDSEGRPLVVYHNTTKSFNKFDLSKARQNSDIPAFFFSSEKGEWA